MKMVDPRTMDYDSRGVSHLLHSGVPQMRKTLIPSERFDRKYLDKNFHSTRLSSWRPETLLSS